MSSQFQSVLAKLKSDRTQPAEHSVASEAASISYIDEGGLVGESNIQKPEAVAQPQATEAPLEDDSIQIYLFKSSEDESLGIQLNEFLVVVSVQEGSPAYHANIPARHRVVTVNHELVTTLTDFGRVLMNAANPMEIHLRLVPIGQKGVFHSDLVDKAVVRMLTENDLDLAILSVNPRFDFLNETSPYHNVFKQRYDATVATIDFLERKVVSFKADKFAKAAPTTNYQTCTAEEFDSALRWLEAFAESKAEEEAQVLPLTNRMVTSATALQTEVNPEEFSIPTFPTDLSMPVIVDAPMAGVLDGGITMEEALKLSAEAFQEALPYDSFLFQDKDIACDREENSEASSHPQITQDLDDEACLKDATSSKGPANFPEESTINERVVTGHRSDEYIEDKNMSSRGDHQEEIQQSRRRDRYREERSSRHDRSDRLKEDSPERRRHRRDEEHSSRHHRSDERRDRRH